MKRNIGAYECQEWYPPDESESNHSQKIVRVRRKHKCSSLDPRVKTHEILPGSYALREKAIVEDMGWQQSYLCIPCMDKWLDEHETF
jgi:hypothetical protein